MNIENFIPLTELCTHYNVEMTFFSNLNEFGLIEIITIEESHFIELDKIKYIEKIIRMVNELDINIAGLEIVFNLLQKIETLQDELNSVRNKLLLYENDLLS